MTSMLTPVLALITWSLIVLLWLYATRIPAMQKAKVPTDPNLTTADLNAAIPANVRWKADNYNHLMEQPTHFYAVAIALALLGRGDGTNLTLAWTYVALRVVHSLVQATWNKIEVRFTLFFLSSLCLVGMLAGALPAALRG